MAPLPKYNIRHKGNFDLNKITSPVIGKISSREALITILGLGYVGLPQAVLFADAGFPVIGIDVDQTKISSISEGKSYVQDVSSEHLKRLVMSDKSSPPSASAETHDIEPGKLHVSTDYSKLAEADVIVMCVPTPLSKTREPDISHIVSASQEMACYIHSDMLIIVESTTYPGTTEEVILPAIQSAIHGPFQVGKDLFLAFSPERIDPGNMDRKITNIPKVIGGITQECTDVANMLYKSVISETVPVSSPTVAEMVKLLENTFRATNIGLINEFAIMCEKLGIDVWEVISAAETKPFGFMPFYPGPGLGGHCIPVDPHYLAWKLRTLSYNARFIQLADEINHEMPSYVVNRVSDVLNRSSKALRGSRILILGVTYKADLDDLRESPALEIINLFEDRGAQVAFHDPFVNKLEVDNISMDRSELNVELLQSSDCVVITTAHSSYKWQWIVDNSTLVFDTRNSTDGIHSKNANVFKL